MNLLENIKLALEGLRANKMRALLTMLGIIIGISSVIAITSLGNTMSKTMNDSLSNLGGRNIQFYIMPKDMSGSYTVTDKDVITNEMLSRFRERYSDSIKGVEITTTVGAANTVDKVPQADMNITGVNHDYFTVENVDVIEGRAISDRDTDGAKNVIVISSITSRSLFGDTTNPIGQEIKVETKNGSESFYIIGVYKDPKESANQNNQMMSAMMTGSDRSAAYIPYTTAKDIMGDTSEGYSNLTVMVQDSVNSTEFAKTAAAYFNKFYPENSNNQVEAQSMESIMNEMNTVMSTVSLVITVIAGISLLVGGIGVMNIMLVSVTERTREIGVRKALGAPNSAIRVQFIVESMIICIIGGILGVLLGAGFGAIGGLLINSPVVPSLGSVALAVCFSMAIGIFFGYYPANKAAKLDPIEALRYE